MSAAALLQTPQKKSLPCGGGGCLLLRGIVFWVVLLHQRGTRLRRPRENMALPCVDEGQGFANAFQLSPFGFPSSNYAHPGKGKKLKNQACAPEAAAFGRGRPDFHQSVGSKAGTTLERESKEGDGEIQG